MADEEKVADGIIHDYTIRLVLGMTPSEVNALRDAITAALVAAGDAARREEREAVVDAAISTCAGWLAMFENGTIQHVSATKYASDAVKDIAENIQRLRARVATKPEDQS